MRCIERGRPVFASQAVGVFGELITAGASNRAAVIHRSRPRVAEQRCQTRLKTLAQFDSQAVVISVTGADQILNASRELRIWSARGSRRRSRHGPVRIDKILELAALRTVIADFERGV